MTPDKPDLERLIKELREIPMFYLNGSRWVKTAETDAAAQKAIIALETLSARLARWQKLCEIQDVVCGIAQERAERAEQEAEGLRKDAERWQAGKRLGFPEFCPHWDGAPNGNGWYHPRLGDACFDSPEDAIDAALASRKGEA
jgi:hypothetical protein